MSLGTTVDLCGGIVSCHWYLERFSISHCNTTPSITKCWLWIIPYVVYGHLVDLSIKSYKSSMERWFHGWESYWPTLLLCPISIWRGWVCFKEVLLLYSPCSGKECYIYGHVVDLDIKSYKSSMERWFHGRESYWPTLLLWTISIWRGWVCFKQV
jgi:hypothetical protein